MKMRKRLLELARLVADQAERDAEFAENLSQVLGFKEPKQEKPKRPSPVTHHPRNRRSPAILDPMAVIRESGEEGLRSRLSDLSLEQLRDIVASYGMDPARLVLKWKNSDRVIARILEVSLSRSQKGDAFRTQ